jgi:excisionase family DNA binding protein
MFKDVRHDARMTAALLTVREVAERLGVCERTVFTLTQEGKLPAARIGRAVRYDPSDIATFIEASKSGGAR